MAAASNSWHRPARTSPRKTGGTPSGSTFSSASASGARVRLSASPNLCDAPGSRRVPRRPSGAGRSPPRPEVNGPACRGTSSRWTDQAGWPPDAAAAAEERCRPQQGPPGPRRVGQRALRRPVQVPQSAQERPHRRRLRGRRPRAAPVAELFHRYADDGAAIAELTRWLPSRGRRIALRLEDNKRFASRNSTGPNPLQGLAACSGCGYGYYRTSTNRPNIDSYNSTVECRRVDPATAKADRTAIDSRPL
jgi:hypothetical protein